MSLLRIELLEDCNISSGRPFNSYLKSNVFHDRHGLPYIPAWILKIQLCRIAREVAHELDEEQYDALAGDGLVMDDALVCGAESMRQAIAASKVRYVRNPQHVIEYEPFSRVITETDMRGESYVRVLKKGLILEAFFECDDALRDLLGTCIASFDAFITDHRVPVLTSVDWDLAKPQMPSPSLKRNFAGKRCRIFYDLHVLSRTCFVSPVNRSAEMDPCIPGSQVQRALMRRADANASQTLDVREITCSYAYISIDDKRGLPLPASFSTEKRDKTDLRDRNSAGRRPDDFDQLKGIGTLYIDDPNAENVRGVEVRMEHGSMAQARGDEESVTRFSAISSFQTFKGFFEGPSAQMEQLYDVLASDGYIRLGDYSDKGFGDADIEITRIEPITQNEPYFVDEFTLLLASPTITHLPDGLYEASARLIVREVESLLGDEIKLDIVRNSQGTYRFAQKHDAWGRLDPIEYAMAPGSIYRLKAQNGQKIDISPILGTSFIGERNNEGFGEAFVIPAVDRYYRRLSKSEFPEEDFRFTFKVDPNPGRMLVRKLIDENTRVTAEALGRYGAKDFLENSFKGQILEDMKLSCGYDFDEKEAFESYIDALKESCLLMLRRG